jgi:hypothetical protein
MRSYKLESGVVPIERPTKPHLFIDKMAGNADKVIERLVRRMVSVSRASRSNLGRAAYGWPFCLREGSPSAIDPLAYVFAWFARFGKRSAVAFPQGLKPDDRTGAFVARLKSCPFKTSTGLEIC